MSSGRPQRLWVYQAGLGQEPVVVEAKSTFLVAVKAMIRVPPDQKEDEVHSNLTENFGTSYASGLCFKASAAVATSLFSR